MNFFRYDKIPTWLQAAVLQYPGKAPHSPREFLLCYERRSAQTITKQERHKYLASRAHALRNTGFTYKKIASHMRLGSPEHARQLCDAYRRQLLKMYFLEDQVKPKFVEVRRAFDIHNFEEF